jgi:hypothetical protein
MCCRMKSIALHLQAQPPSNSPIVFFASPQPQKAFREWFRNVLWGELMPFKPSASCECLRTALRRRFQRA